MHIVKGVILVVVVLGVLVFLWDTLLFPGVTDLHDNKEKHSGDAKALVIILVALTFGIPLLLTFVLPPILDSLG